MEQAQIEPGERSPAPGPLRVIQLFVNTNDLETGPDLLPDAAALRAWLLAHELLGADESVTTRTTRARSSCARRSAASSRPMPGSTTTGRPARSSTRPAAAPAWCLCSRIPATRFEPTAGGVDGALGHIVAAIHAAIAEGTWDRLKACERDICRWAFYDHSKNRSGHWCSMAVCGQREKNRRAYRRRRARVA